MNISSQYQALQNYKAGNRAIVWKILTSVGNEVPDGNVSDIFSPYIHSEVYKADIWPKKLKNVF